MKKFNKVLTSGMLMGLILPLFSTSVLAKDDPESGKYDKYGDIITEDDELYKECVSDPDTYLSTSKDYDRTSCVVKKEVSRDWNASRDKSSYQSKNKVYYPKGYGFAPVNIAEIKEGEFLSFGTALDFSEFITSKDIGKQIKIELELHNIKNSKELPYPQGMMSNVFQHGALSKEKSSIRDENGKIDMYGIKYVSDGFIEGVFTEIQEGIVEGDVLDLNNFVDLMPTDEYVKEASQWKSFDDIKITKNTPYLNAKIIVGDEVRINGPVAAYVGVPKNLIDEAREKLDMTRLDDSFFHKDFLSNPDKKTTPEQYAMLRNNIKMFDDFYYPQPDPKDNQGVNANVLNGGLTGGIVSTEVEKELSIEDIDFGKLFIGKEIKPVENASMVSVRDWTGGNGWKLTAQHKEADRNESLQLGVQVNENAKVDLNNEAQPVTSGESQLDVTTQGGKYTAEWGTHPTAGEFNNVIEWNLSANVTE